MTLVPLMAKAQVTEDDATLTIDAGRLVAVLNQVTSLMKLPDVEEPASQDPTQMLEFVIARYNRLKDVACARAIVEGPECGVTYAPNLQADPVPLSVLRREVDEVQSHVVPFWQTVCAELDDPRHPVCQME